MKFDFELFSTLAQRAYASVENPAYTLEQALDVFSHYFSVYEDMRHAVHPPIRMEQIKRIVEAMPYIEDEHGITDDVEAEAYKRMIDKHFRTPYRNCDYNINHFFSGDVRRYRFYEEC